MSIAASTVLILGARGRLGLAAARAFAQAGWQVRAQVRPGAAGPAVPGVQWIAVAPQDTPALVAAAQGAQVVVHAMNPAYTHKAWRKEAPMLMDAAIEVTRTLGATLMLPGSVYNYGRAMPPVLREDTPQTALDFKGRLRIHLEQRLQAATRDGAMRAVVVRAGDFFGSGAGSWLDQSIAKDLPKGRVTWPGPLDISRPWAYLPDLARTLVRVAEERHRLSAFDTLHFAGQQVTAHQWVRVLSAVAAEQGWAADAQTLRAGQLPWPLLRMAGLVVPHLAALADMRYLWNTPHRLDNTRLAALIGEEPHTPFEQAVRRALHDLGLLAPAHPQAALA
ncbi:NAD-dependent epimerase/dehydratase family protein [Acidovorax sp. A1169]|jgi:nucleoside-diphosphate-sugar epimerase|uniref:NAD-dependent epimerase/dehydratase family protein n=1 Tax=Acidovorax sp. A1169 TaxID=3059524 RepID=UPI002738019E|nr:NAD-dependent epimerase/dehydratase family protein [Acidovorax sp. A1169]MDP4076079.1 NAD-dependent epimerase/dehydratase family protein [Acidovorax sp. A1169]